MQEEHAIRNFKFNQMQHDLDFFEFRCQIRQTHYFMSEWIYTDCLECKLSFLLIGLLCSFERLTLILVHDGEIIG